MNNPEIEISDLLDSVFDAFTDALSNYFIENKIPDEDQISIVHDWMGKVMPKLYDMIDRRFNIDRCKHH